MSGQRIVYGAHDRPAVEVQLGDKWWPGEIRTVSELEDGTRQHSVQYRTDDGEFVENFPKEKVRKPEV